MHLNRTVAKRIVDHIGDKLHHAVSVLDPSNIVLASTHAGFVGKHIKQPDNRPDQVAHARLPLIYEGAEIGSIVIHEPINANDDMAQLIKALAELIISQTTIIARLPNRQDVLNIFIYDLLHERLQHTPQETLQEASMLGIDLTVPRLVVLVYIEPFAFYVTHEPGHARQAEKQPIHFDNVSAEQRRQIRALLLQHIHEVMPPNENNVYSFVDDHRLVALVVTDPEALDVRRQQISRNFQQFIDMTQQSIGVRLSAGIGYHYPEWQDLAQSRADAQCALDIGRKLYGAGRVYAMMDLGLAAFIGEERQQTKIDLANRMLRPLMSEPELLKTLDVFFRSELSSSSAADQLNIHRHTLSYRLDKIANLTGLNPREFSAAAQLSTALLIQKLQEAEHK